MCFESVDGKNCDTTEISKLVRKYNNHKAMNQSQKAYPWNISLESIYQEQILKNYKNLIDFEIEKNAFYGILYVILIWDLYRESEDVMVALSDAQKRKQRLWNVIVK